jgi:hypothetical protein
MRRFLCLSSLACVLIGGCAYPYYPYYAPTGATLPADFDRSWDAALGALNDTGVQVTRADRSQGRITGSKAGAAVTVDLQPQADKSLKVAFSAPDSKEANPTLAERWTSAYNRRMGR